jgi:hypothetical protein
MGLAVRLFGARGLHSQQAVAERAAQVIHQVIFDLGVDRLVQGTVQLDASLRPHFYGSEPRTGKRAQASVALAGLAEAAVLRDAAGNDVGRAPHTSALVAALLREFHTQSPRFRSLP